MMSHRMHRYPGMCRVLTACLITSLCLQLPITASAKEPEFISVAELHRHSIHAEDTQKITDQLREELSHYSHLKVLPKAETKAIIDYHQRAILEQGAISPIQSLVAEAKKAYFALALGRADSLCKQAIENSLKMSPKERDYRALLEAHTVQGIVALALHRKSEASESFRKLVYYNPQVYLDERYFAPSVIRRINRVKRELKDQPTGTIEINARPSAADIYVNGVFRGTAPLKLEGYPSGEHVVSIKAANYMSQSQIVNVSSGAVSRVFSALRWKGKKNLLPEQMVGFHEDQFQTTEQLIGAAAHAARAMRVRKMILVSLEEEGSQERMQAHIVDAHLETFHRSQSVSGTHIIKDSDQASKILAQQVLNEMNRSIMENPQELAAAPYYGDVVLIGSKRSLLKSPWFWISIGTVAAGGTAAGILAGGTTTTGAINVLFR